MSTAYTRTLASLALALATFSGTLLDKTTGQPLTKVQVHVTGPATADATTDAHGRFTLKNLAPGAYTINVQSNDVPPQTFTVKLVGNRITVLTIKACSTTLDYHCAAPGGGPGPG
ncbi:MAG TPA: carboxypeptidase regulatory-like domain-containing protein [Verrucomicrobiae bacterium]|nr:carboxypeptidase regulatory-like domain-containing protein [Verrucomicrobiae bacterium]